MSISQKRWPLTPESSYYVVNLLDWSTLYMHARLIRTVNVLSKPLSTNILSFFLLYLVFQSMDNPEYMHVASNYMKSA
jgi:hypothetical protein